MTSSVKTCLLLSVVRSFFLSSMILADVSVLTFCTEVGKDVPIGRSLCAFRRQTKGNVVWTFRFDTVSSPCESEARKDGVLSVSTAIFPIVVYRPLTMIHPITRSLHTVLTLFVRRSLLLFFLSPFQVKSCSLKQEMRYLVFYCSFVILAFYALSGKRSSIEGHR